MNPDSNNRYDIAVVGAGPAGSMSARFAAGGGRRVCLLERKARVGVPVRCGEGIGLKSLQIAESPDNRWVQTTIKKVCFVSPSGLHIRLGNIEESCIVDREIMDAALVERAVKAGASYFPSTCVTHVGRVDERTYRCSGPQGDLFASCVILADGVESRLARDVGWDTSLQLDDIESCAFCRVSHDSIEDDTVCFYVGGRYAPNGYAWVFPRARGLANVGLGMLGTDSQGGKANQYLSEFVSRVFSGATVTELHCGGVPVGKWVKPLVREGVMLVGDAARQVNSFSGAGLGYALFAGRAAGETAAAAFDNGMCNYRLLRGYQKLWTSHYGKQQVRSYKLKSLLLRRSNDEFLERIARSLANADPERLNYMSVFLRAFARHPLHLLRVFRLFG